MPVLIQTPVINYTANGSVTDFAYPFQVLNEADLKVYIDAVEVTGGFTNDGVGNAAGGNVIFEIAPLENSVVRLIRTTSISRITDYVEGGAIPAATIDTDFDRAVMMVQELDALCVKENSSGVIDLTNRRVANIGTPINAGDAISKGYHDGTFIPQMNALVLTATTQATNSSNSATASAGSATTSANSATASAGSASASATSASNAATSETNAASSAVLAASYSSGVTGGNNTWTGLNQFNSNVTIGSTVAMGKLTVYGTRSYFGANAELYSIALGFNTGRVTSGQVCYIGATDSATPDLVFSNSGGVRLFTMGSSGQWGIGSSPTYGTSGQVLTSGGAAAAPTWTTPVVPVSFPAGTAMLFAQAAAPTGWTKSTTHNDKALRVVSGATGGSAAGTVEFSTVFSRTASDGSSLSVAQLAAHTHLLTDLDGGSNYVTANRVDFIPSVSGYSTTFPTGSTGSGASHSHGMDIRVQYVDVIICTKD